MLLSSRFWCSTVVTLSLCAGGGCVPVALLQPPQVTAGLSYLILQPEVTCQELRDRYHVNMDVVDNPAEAGLEYQEHRVPLDETNSLRVWYLPAEADRGTVVFSMGDAGNMACYLFSAKLLLEGSWSVVMYEYEGFGGSDGEPTLDSLTRDLRAVIQWTRALTGREQVTLMGMSLGSIPTIALAVEMPDAVNAVVLDSPIALGTQVIRFGFLVLGQSEPLIRRLSPELLSENIIGNMYQPLLIFSHELDFIATEQSNRLLFDRAAGPKELVLFEGLGHALGQFMMTGEYIYYLEDFLTSVWTPDAPEVAAP